MLDFFLLMLALGFPLMLIGIVLLVRAAGRQRDRNISNASDILAGLFDGSPQVSYTSTWGIGLPPAELLPGAARHGYRMTSQAEQGKHSTIFYFEKIA